MCAFIVMTPCGPGVAFLLQAGDQSLATLQPPAGKLSATSGSARLKCRHGAFKGLCRSLVIHLFSGVHHLRFLPERLEGLGGSRSELENFPIAWQF